jgi:D-glycero-D-manno-heptose 1,7-bisphosphate phosphatase
MKRAVFLDRDGVINELVLHASTNEYEPPHNPYELKILPYVIESLIAIQNLGYELFLISNQPDYAKGKTTMQNLLDVHQELEKILKKNKIEFKEFFYCYHHPGGVIDEYSFACSCRKPNTYFIEYATQKYEIDLVNSWIIGDRDSDILCGQKAGLKTISVHYVHSSSYRGNVCADFSVGSISDCIAILG